MVFRAILPTVAAAMGLLAPCDAATAAEPDAIARSGYVQQIEPIAPGVHVIRQPGVSFMGLAGNVTVIEQSDGLVLVDSGNAHGAGRRVAALVRSVSDKPVKAIVLTHFHSDHSLGLSGLLETWPDADVIAHEATAADMAGQMADIPTAPDPAFDAVWAGRVQRAVDLAQTELATSDLSEDQRTEWSRTIDSAPLRAADATGMYRVVPKRLFRDRLVLEDRVAPVEILFLGRANTAGDTVVWAPRQRVLAAGDVVVAPIPYMFSAHVAEQIEVVRRIAAYDFAVLIPGHGAPQTDKTYLSRLGDLMSVVQARVTPLVGQDMALETIQSRDDFADQRRVFAGDDPWLIRWFDAYALTPLIESVYHEARGEPVD